MRTCDVDELPGPRIGPYQKKCKIRVVQDYRTTEQISRLGQTLGAVYQSNNLRKIASPRD